MKLDAEEAIAKAMAARDPARLAQVRVAQEERVAALKAELDAAGDDHPVAKVLAKKGSTKLGMKFRKAIKKPKGTLALIGEGVFLDSPTLGGYDLNDATYLSEQFRTAGCAAVCAGPTLSEDALAKTVKEQQVAKGEYPGPLPVLAKGDVIDAVQLAALAADGATAVLLDMVLNGEEGTKKLAQEAEGLGLEAIPRVGNEAELKAALAWGVQTVCVGDCSFEQAVELKAAIPKEVVSICDMWVRDVRGTWKVRDLGYNGLLLSKALFDVCIRDRVPPDAVIKAMMSKGSVEFGLGMQKGRLEGAKEVLGSMAM